MIKVKFGPSRPRTHLAPDNSHLRLVGAPGDAGLVLGLVHVGAPLANVPP